MAARKRRSPTTGETDAKLIARGVAPGLGAHRPVSWCSECGEGVPVDEDGCCATCGVVAIGPGAEQACRLAELARKVLGVDGALYVPGPDEDVGEVLLDAEDWDELVKLAREDLKESA